jgi:hypothetical protein
LKTSKWFCKLKVFEDNKLKMLLNLPYACCKASWRLSGDSRRRRKDFNSSSACQELNFPDKVLPNACRHLVWANVKIVYKVSPYKFVRGYVNDGTYVN